MQILTIRYYQIKRNLGFLFLVLLPLFTGLSYFFFNNKQELGYYVAALILYLFYTFHKNRKDILFACKHFNAAKWQIATEYQLFLLPVSIPSLFTRYWYCFPVMHLVVLCIPFAELKTNLQPKLLFLSRLFKKDYMFISGIRRTILILLPLFLLALVLSPLKLFPLVALFLVNATVFTFYEHNESVQMLQASHQTPKQFLSEITMSAVFKLTAINVPVLLINSLFNADVLLFNLYFLGYILLMMVTVISMKYADYGYRKEKNNFQIKLMVMVMGLFIPYLSILGLVFYVQARTEAIKNLTNYLDDISEGSVV